MPDTPQPKTRRSLLRFLLYGMAFVLLAVVVLALLFVINGTLLAKNETPYVVKTDYRAATESDPREIKVLAYNIAKCFVYKEGGEFASREDVVSRLDRMAELINDEQPDIVFLSETVTECGPCDVNQVAYLAEATQMHHWAFGENYNFGLPFYRVVGGNAILSRWPLVPESNPSLAGRRPFYVTKNNRRVLWCKLHLGSEELLLGSIHTDSFHIDNNHRQTKQILEYCADRPTLIAGDFNANPDESSIQTIREAEKFSGEFDPPKTFPAEKPDQTLDYIFAPASWRLVDHRVLSGAASDHLAVVSTFERSGTKTAREE